jgi:hypothetical protein
VTVPFISVPQAHADKGNQVIYTDHLPDNPLTPKPGDKKLALPYAALPCFPCNLSAQVTTVGGHVHAVEPGVPPVLKELNPVLKPGVGVTYNEISCADGSATGALDFIEKIGGSTTGNVYNLEITYQRVGPFALLLGNEKSGEKDTQVVALLVFHPKVSPDNLEARCAPGSTAAASPIKVEFITAGVLVQSGL